MTSQSPDYRKGYAAGRRKRARDDMQTYIYSRRQDFRNQALLVALPAIMRGDWSIGSDRVSSIEGYVDLAVKAANALTDKASFVDDRDFHKPDEQGGGRG